MTSEKKIRTKAAAELASLLKDEKAHLARNRRTRNLIMAAGIACLLIAWAIAGTPWNWTAANAALAAMLGGFMCGLCMAFDNSMRAWPVIRPLLRDDALDRLKEGTP
jgi:hypothetical protein